MGKSKLAPVSFVMIGLIKEKPHFVVVRDDSTIELHEFSDFTTPPTLIFQTKETDTITGLVIGHVTNTKYREILFTCYSGAVKSLVSKK